MSNLNNLTIKGQSKSVLGYSNYCQDSCSSSKYGDYPETHVPRGKSQMETITSYVLVLKVTYVSALVYWAVTITYIQGGRD